MSSYNEEIKWPFKDDIIDEKTVAEVSGGKVAVPKYHNEMSHNKITKDLLSSFTQKSMRRNSYDKALWGAIEWGLFRCGQLLPDKNGKLVNRNKGIITNLKRRIMISYMEDVGIANINLWEYINDRYEYIDFGEKSEEMFYTSLIECVGAMSQTKHIRLISYVKLICNLYRQKNEYIKHFPSFVAAFQYIESNQNKSLERNLHETLMDRNIASFYYIMKMIYDKEDKKYITSTNYKKVIIPLYERVFKNKGMDPKYLKWSYEWYKSIQNEEAYYAILMPVMMVVFDIVENGRVGNRDDSDNWRELVLYNIKNYPPTIDSYAADIHTFQGNLDGYKKTNRRGIKKFIFEGSKTDQEITNKLIREMKHLYEFNKMLPFTDTKEKLERLKKKYIINFEE